MQSWLKNLGLEGLKLPPLKVGAHKRPEDGLCAMEMVAFIERLPHSDRPACTSPVVASLVIFVNDTLGDGRRHELLPWLPRVVGTVAPAYERARAYAILQAVFDLAVRLDRPRLLPKHLHDPATGLRVAAPPWDYARWLGERQVVGGFADEWHHTPYDARMIELVRQNLYSALVAVDSVEVVDRALAAAWQIKQVAGRFGYWAREAIRGPVDERVVADGAALEHEITLKVQHYDPDWTAWRFALLEHVLAIGPKAGGWTRNGVEVAHRVERLAEMV